MAITVTATPTGGSGNLLRVLVLTGATASGGKAAHAAPTGSTISVTPNGSNSFIVWSIDDRNSATSMTAFTNNTLLDNVALSGIRLGSGYYSGTVTASSAVTCGVTNVDGSNGYLTAAYEVLASGGSTPSIDASSPAAVSHTTGTTACTTTSFTPPGGAVVVAIVNGANFPSAWTVTDSSSMTWTKQVDSADGQQVWTATVAGGGTSYDADVSTTITETPTATAALAAVAAVSQTVSAATTAAAALGATATVSATETATTTAAAALAAVAAVSLSATATVTAGATVTSGTAYDADVTTTATASVTAAAAMAGVAAVSLTATAAVTAGATVTTPAGPFPGSPLDLAVELDVNGWTDITSYVYARSDLSITRGRQDESTTTQPAQLTSTWDNRDGRFSSKNPTSPYYPYLGRNTPLRVSVPEATTYLRLEVDQSSYASAPDSSGLSITGDTEIQIDVTADNWNAQQILASKWVGTGDERSWLLQVNEDATLTFQWSADGSAKLTAQSTAAVPIPGLRRQSLRVTLAVASGTVTFYTSPTALSGSPSWTQLGSPVVIGANSVFDSTAPLLVGWNTTDLLDGLQGKIWAFKLFSGIGGTVKASPDFTAQTAGDTSFADTQGNTWTLAGTAELSARKYRFHGELSAVPQAWDETGGDVWCDIQASGISRRLGQNTETLGSAFTRALPSAVGLIGFWTCEDGNTTSFGTTPATPTQFASAIQGVAPGTFTKGPPSFASDDTFLCSQSLPVINGSRWHFRLPGRAGADTANVFRFLLHMPSASDTDSGVIGRMYTTGTVGRFDLVYSTGGALTMVGYDQSGSSLFSSGPWAFGLDGTPVWCSMELQTSGGSVQYSVTTLQPGATTGLSPNGTVSGSIGNATLLVINGDLGHALQETAAGQVTYQTQWESLFDFGSQLNAWQGEAAGQRFSRLCAEQNVPFRWIGNLDDTVVMGAQTPLAYIDLLQECADADRGAMYEPREAVALGYRTRASMQNQAAGVTLDYSQALLAQPVGVTEDDQYTKNDVAVTRAYAPGGGTGSSYQAVLETGTLSIQAPPDGVGDYPDSETINLNLDSQLPDSAGWILWLGTVDDPRYPQIMVDLARAELLADTTLWYAVQDLDLDDRLVITNTPAWLPPDGITQLANGVTETLNAFKYTISWCCVPELPYETGIVGDPVFAEVDTDGSTLHANITSSATSIQIGTTAATPTYLWSTASGDRPFDILIGGERMTVTALSGSSSPQSATVTRSVNGVVKAHSAGEAVTLFYPTIVSL